MADEPVDPALDRLAAAADFTAAGWHRFLPSAALSLYVAGVESGWPDGEVPVGGGSAEGFGACRRFGGRLDDDPLADLRAEPVDDGGSSLAEDDARLTGLGAELGLEIVTNRDLLVAMETLGLVELTGWRDGLPDWRAVRTLPLPQDRLALSPAERRHEDRIRWRELHAPAATAITQVLLERRPTVVGCSLASLAEVAGLDPEDGRYGLLLLAAHGDILTTVDLEQITHSERFEFAVAWPRVEARVRDAIELARLL